MRVSVARGLVTTAFLFGLFTIVSTGTQEDPYLGAMARGNALLVRNQFEDALKEFKAASAARNKTSVEAHLAMARAYQGLGAYKNALDSATDALRLAADDKKFEAFSRNTRGIALIALAGNDSKDKRLKEAESEFRAVLALGNAVPLARYNLGLALLKQVRDDEGVQELKTFISEKRTGPEVQNAMQYVQNPRRVRENYAPAFTGTTLSAEYFDLQDQVGKVVLIDFWASWCEPCRAATPALVDINKKYAEKRFLMVSVSHDYTREPFERYVTDHRMLWPQIFDNPQRIGRVYNPPGLPTYVIVDHEGISRGTRTGWGPDIENWLRSELAKYVNAAAKSINP